MDEIEITEYSEQFKNYFKTLNLEWIEKFFVVLTTDEYVLLMKIHMRLQKWL
jgi:hypothetical protein